MKRLVVFSTLLVALLALGVLVQPVAAQQQTSVTWRAEYFDNPYLILPAKINRNEGNLAFNWGTGSPGNGIPDDNWSARFTADPFFSAGRYRFNILADDGIKLWVGLQKVLDTYEAARPGEMLTYETTLPAGVTQIQVDFVERIGTAHLYVSWTNLDTGVTTQPFTGPIPQQVPITPGAWTAQYFNNPTLSGMPVATLVESGPNHNWGFNAPLPNMPADNFSVRWTSQQYLEGGTYQFNLRTDDGVRIFVDGVQYLDGWQGKVAQQLTATVTLGTGYHTFVVEYYELSGLAYLEYSMTRVGTQPAPPSQPTSPTGAFATVSAWRLNVRQTPDPVNGTILTRVERGNVLPVLQRDASSGWWKIRVNGIDGWVSGQWVNVSNSHNVPTVNGQPAPAPRPPDSTGYVLTTTANLNVRTGSGVWANRIGVIPEGGAASIIARNANSTWWEVNFSGLVGWVSGSYVILPGNININAIPVK